MTTKAREVAVLDNEAAQAISSPRHPKQSRLLNVFRASRSETALLVVPVAVRIEAGLDRSSSAATGLGQWKVEDFSLTGVRSDRAIALGRGLSASVVDATVAQCAEEFAAAGARVTVYTADVSDLEKLCGRASGRISVRRV